MPSKKEPNLPTETHGKRMVHAGDQLDCKAFCPITDQCDCVGNSPMIVQGNIILEINGGPPAIPFKVPYRCRVLSLEKPFPPDRGNLTIRVSQLIGASIDVVSDGQAVHQPVEVQCHQRTYVVAEERCKY